MVQTYSLPVYVLDYSCKSRQLRLDVTGWTLSRSRLNIVLQLGLQREKDLQR
jgi:hypothetical protein